MLKGLAQATDSFDSLLNLGKGGDCMSYKVSFSVNHGIALAFIVGLIAGLTYIIDQNTPVTVSMVLMGIVIGLTAALHYEQDNSTPPDTSPQNPQAKQVKQSCKEQVVQIAI